METNPYKSTAGPELRRALPMRTRIVWFIIGFVVSWGAWRTIQYFQLRPRDAGQMWRQGVREKYPWLKHAVVRQAGNYIIVAPADTSNASAMVYHVADTWHGAMFTDDDLDSRAESIIAAASREQWTSFDDDDSDGRFDTLSYTTDGITMEAVSLYDNNLDGQADLRIGPAAKVAVWIEHQWRDLIIEDDGRFVEVKGQKRAVDVVDRVYSLVDEE